MKKSREGLYTSEAEYNFLEQWEAMRSRSEIIQGSPITPITYANNEMLGLTTDCRNLTKATCGIAIKGDQMSLIADLILEIGITRAPRVLLAQFNESNSTSLPGLMRIRCIKRRLIKRIT